MLSQNVDGFIFKFSMMKSALSLTNILSQIKLNQIKVYLKLNDFIQYIHRQCISVEAAVKY